jgi:3-oxoadipate enol-lactonase / 4-carboxymuconolactone decarboxylase
MMTVPAVSAVQLGGDRALPLLMIGPSLGTFVHALWGEAAQRLGSDFHVVGWDLPGHGRANPVTDAFTMAELADGVLALVDKILVERGEPGGRFAYAGVSAGGAVGLELLIDHPGRITAATLLATGAVIGSPQSWSERADLVRTRGTSAIVDSSAQRWFASGFVQRRPEAAGRLLDSLRDTDAASYALVCDALAGFDVRDKLGTIVTPVLAVAGASDPVTPVSSLQEIADGVCRGRLVVIDHAAHLAPTEAPAEVARLVEAHVRTSRTVGEVTAAGMEVRRAVLGDAHVDRATAYATDFTRDFHDLLTQYAWGTIWTRPGLDRRSRSLITLTALVARGHHEELALHLRAARTNGLTLDEIKEVLLQTAVYCGIPDANTAFRIAADVFAEPDES